MELIASSRRAALRISHAAVKWYNREKYCVHSDGSVKDIVVLSPDWQSVCPLGSNIFIDLTYAQHYTLFAVPLSQEESSFLSMMVGTLLRRNICALSATQLHFQAANDRRFCKDRL